METNADRKEMNADLWVTTRMSCLSPEGNWRPDLAWALTRFDERRNAGNGRVGRWAWALAAVAAVSICLFALPAPRIFLGHAPYLAIVNVGQVSADGVTLKYGQAAPDFTLPNAAGENVRLSAYKGQVVLLNFWATWCPACTTEIPWLIEFQSEYRAKGLAVLGVSMDDNGWKAVQPFVAAEKLNYPVMIGNDQLAKSYGLSAMPMTFLIDRGGKIVATSVGVVDKSACEREIVELLAK
jgi:peroxiredoxin